MTRKEVRPNMFGRWKRGEPLSEEKPPAPVKCATCRQTLIGNGAGHECKKPDAATPIVIPTGPAPQVKVCTDGVSRGDTPEICAGCGEDVRNDRNHRCTGKVW